MSFFFFNDTATTEIYTLSLHNALPIYDGAVAEHFLEKRVGDFFAVLGKLRPVGARNLPQAHKGVNGRSEEHTSELQSRQYLVCRLLLEKKKKTKSHNVRTR